MAAKVKYLIVRDGRYHARLVVPPRLRSKLGKSELSAALGADRRKALRDLPRIVGQFQDQLESAAASLARESVKRVEVKPRAPKDPLAVARAHFTACIADDQAIRDKDHLYAEMGFAGQLELEAFRRVVAGKADTEEIFATMLPILVLERHQHLSDIESGTAEWRILMRYLAQAEIATMNVAVHRDEAEPDPPLPEFLKAPVEDSSPSGVIKSIREIFAGYLRELQAAGKGIDAEKRWSPIIESLVSFLSHNNASRLTRQDALRWKDELLATKSPKTVRDTYIATARAAFSWALDNMHVATNPFTGVKVRFAKKTRSRDKGFNDAEALGILQAAHSYKTPNREDAKTGAAKRWSPFLAAYTGARITELTQLRKDDVRQDGGIHFIRIAPDAGTVKSGEFRDVPLHSHLIELGFLDYVKTISSGPLFHNNAKPKGMTGAARTVSGRISNWVRKLNIADKGVAPNHGWRHRLKTVGREMGISDRTLDAIQGHAARTAGDGYGTVSLKTKANAIESLPNYAIK